MRQRAGLIVPLFSLRGQEGIGTIGDLPAFAALAHEIGFSLLGLLPLQRLFGGETSPYGADSAFALDPIYLELAALPELQGNVLDRELPAHVMLASREFARCALVLYNDVRKFKEQAFEIAFHAFDEKEWKHGTERAQAFERFREGTPWIRDVALFSALRDAYGGHGWTTWPQALRDRNEQALADAEVTHERRIRYHAWLQFALLEQWTRARAQIQNQGIALFGDVPFGLGTESVDVWAHPHWFRRDASLGVPPDAFSATGQDWGLPPFDISAMREGPASPFQFFRQRLRATRALYDEFRMDHVVGYFRQWLWQGLPPQGHFTPGDEPAQHALGRELLELFREEIDGVPRGVTRSAGWGGESAIVAEDLGVIPPFCREVLTDLGMAGYKVIPWERENGLHDPRKYPELSVATYSTHDTMPIGRWVTEMEPWERDELFRLAGIEGHDDHEAQLLKLFELLFSSSSARAFVLASELTADPTRINTPGTTGGHNWTWRLPLSPAGLRADPVHSARFAKVREILERTGRTGNPA